MPGMEHFQLQKLPSITFDDIRVIFSEPTKIDQVSKRKEKKISDLPTGSVTLSFGSLNLRERKLTSLEGLEIFPELKTLYLQDNCLTDLRYLNQPNLESLHAERNSIRDFAGCRRHPKLRSVHLEGNFVESSDLFPLMCCLSLNTELMRVNGQIVSKSERELISMLDRPALHVALQQVLSCNIYCGVFISDSLQEQGWMISTQCNKNAALDISADEFFFRLEPSIEQLRQQHEPITDANFDVFFHLKRSYERLAGIPRLVSTGKAASIYHE
jgi:hypothetical protein